MNTKAFAANCDKPVSWRDYLTLCKPRVVLLMIITAIVGMCLASDGALAWSALIWGNLGIALTAFSAAALNHVADQHIDKIMSRTQSRPMAQGKISTKQSLLFATALGIIGMFILIYFVNIITAVLTFASLVCYAGIYTLYLKHATPQNIVIGGIAGASPPLLGWTAVTGHISAEPLLLMLIIFVWTPPHFWALAIYRLEDYKNANVPMLPFTHGVSYTKLNILLYTILLFGVTLLPYAIGMSGMIYLIGACVINLRFLQWAVRLYRSDEPKIAIQTFRYSICYLGYIFMLLLFDHYFYLF